MSKVTSTAKLPLTTFIGKGSYSSRLDYACKLNEQFYQLTKDSFSKGSISVLEYKKVLQSLLPKNIKFHIARVSKQELKNDFLACIYMDGRQEQMDYCVIKMPYMPVHGKNNKNAKINSNLRSTILHENFHFFAALANPKHSCRYHFKTDKDWDIYQECLYGSGVNFPLIKIKKLLNHLKKLKIKDRIDFLQSSRYRLIEEDFAYSEEDKYGLRTYNYDLYAFREKIWILETLLALNLKKARRQNKLNLKNKTIQHA